MAPMFFPIITRLVSLSQVLVSRDEPIRCVLHIEVPMRPYPLSVAGVGEVLMHQLAIHLEGDAHLHHHIGAINCVQQQQQQWKKRKKERSNVEASHVFRIL